jgi:hypothetical protein
LFFQGKLGLFPGAPVTIKLLFKSNAKPNRERAFPVPRIHEQLLKVEVNLLVSPGVSSQEKKQQ